MTRATATDASTVLIMAAGTGGHVFPALSIAQALRAKGVSIAWLGTPDGMENRLLEGQGIPLHKINMKGVKGNGLLRLLLAPFMVARATFQATVALRAIRPACVLGMGGFICGPGGLAAKLLGKPLVLHEQNAVAGSANRILSLMADRVLQAFPATFKPSQKLSYTGNPVRDDIVEVGRRELKRSNPDVPLNILVLGGSQGALAINKLIPTLLARWEKSQSSESFPNVLHQAGRGKLDATIESYAAAEIEVSDKFRVVEFVENMAEAYGWADLIICRSGASTVCEISVVGLPAIFIPYPHHKDQQQTFNANWLGENGAALVVEQRDIDEERMLSLLLELHDDRDKLFAMACNAREIAIVDASDVIAKICLEVADD